MVLELRIYGDPVLREQGLAVEAFDGELRELAENMVETMRVEQGVGLAAQQVGLPRMICVVHVPEEYDTNEEGVRENPDLLMPLVLVNPEITSQSDDQSTAEEGCLSFPGISAPIARSCVVSLTYQDLEGTRHDVDANGFVARVIQHEIDHLNGVLFTDHMKAVKRVALSGRLKRMRKETRQHLGLA